MKYIIYCHGQITRFEAGTIYRAAKEGNIKVVPEVLKSLYNQTTAPVRLAESRYNQDFGDYDYIYDATQAILDQDYKKAQLCLRIWTNKQIKQAGSKSLFYEYHKRMTRIEER